MDNLIVAAVVLLGTHFGLSSTQLRSQLVGSVGEPTFRILYSAITLVAIAWMVVAWRAAPYQELWAAGPALRHLPLLAMPFALLLAVCAVSQPNPTAVGASPDPDAAEPATGILRVTRHPLMWAFAVWGLAHMLANGDVASLLFFGTFVVLALVGTVLIDHKRTRRNEPGWGVFLQATSNLPLAAIVERRQRFVPREIGATRPIVAIALFVALILLHPLLFGVPVLGN